MRFILSLENLTNSEVCGIKVNHVSKAGMELWSRGELLVPRTMLLLIVIANITSPTDIGEKVFP